MNSLRLIHTIRSINKSVCVCVCVTGSELLVRVAAVPHTRQRARGAERNTPTKPLRRRCRAVRPPPPQEAVCVFLLLLFISFLHCWDSE